MNIVENELLGALLSCSNENYDSNIQTAAKNISWSLIECVPVIKSLERQTMIQQIDNMTVHINPLGRLSYVSKQKQRKDFILKYLTLTIKNLLVFIVGVISGALGGFLSSYLVTKLLSGMIP